MSFEHDGRRTRCGCATHANDGSKCGQKTNEQAIDCCTGARKVQNGVSDEESEVGARLTGKEQRRESWERNAKSADDGYHILEHLDHCRGERPAVSSQR